MMQLRPLSKMGRDGKERKKWGGMGRVGRQLFKRFYLYLPLFMHL